MREFTYEDAPKHMSRATAIFWAKIANDDLRAHGHYSHARDYATRNVRQLHGGHADRADQRRKLRRNGDDDVRD